MLPGFNDRRNVQAISFYVSEKLNSLENLTPIRTRKQKQKDEEKEKWKKEKVQLEDK